MKLLAGFLLAFGIGAFCRLIRVPSPAPQAIVGSLLVVTMSVGYVTAGRMIDRLRWRAASQQASPLTQEENHASYPIQPVR
jgi:XapX domain-containing protein